MLRAHLVGDADDHLEVGADAGAVAGFFDLLEVAVAVGDGAGFLVQVGGGKDDVGEAAVSVRNMSWTTRKVFLRVAGSMS